MTDQIARRWAEQFGLAENPLFAAEEFDGVEHHVLLDGGFGSFAISSTKEPLWKDERTAQWAWSSDLPHHLTVTDKVVAVTRWDRPNPELLNLTSVEAHIESFYLYLTNDRVRSTRRVVDHVLNLYRRVRTLVAKSDLPDERSIEAFLGFLELLIARDPAEPSRLTTEAIAPPTFGEVVAMLPSSGVEALMEDLEARPSMQAFRLFPALAVRHAGSEIFQEAHFALLRSPGLDLFGFPGASEAQPVTRGGAHFTPAPLARTMVEQTLQHVADLSTRDVLTILDPACGSGAFLQEAIRTLRRLRHRRKVVIVGRDISPAAIAMARFALMRALCDWSDAPEIRLDIEVADSLSDPLPESDVVLMNPPFVAWSALTGDQRDRMAEILGPNLQGRGDLSMAFVSRALERLTSGGALGVLLPASLLTLEAAIPWRREILEQAHVRLLASLGDYGLFAHALVQVAAAVVSKPPASATDAPITALVTSNSGDATGNALRSLRKLKPGHTPSEGEGWRIFDLPADVLKARSTWRLTSPRTETALRRLSEAGAVPLSELFDVRQGVLTGLNDAFLLDEEEFLALPRKEQDFFRPAVMSESIQDGQLKRRWWVFYPYSKQGPRLGDEASLQGSVPQYMRRFLEPHRAALEKRSSIVRANRNDWWGISDRRATWMFTPKPRILSKYFGSSGGFALDFKAEFVVVQGYAWLPKFDVEQDEDGQALSLEGVMQAYVALVNSPRFSRVLELFCPHVAGGQFNLSPRYVDSIPMLDLAAVATDERLGRLVRRLSELGVSPRPRDPHWASATDRIVSEMYGADFFDEL